MTLAVILAPSVPTSQILIRGHASAVRPQPVPEVPTLPATLSVKVRCFINV
jgi:hypothetical protein